MLSGPPAKAGSWTESTDTLVLINTCTALQGDHTLARHGPIAIWRLGISATIIFAIVIAAHSAMALPARVAPAFDTPLTTVALGEDRSETVLSTRRQTLLIQRIQIRLAELGIYEGTIEGEMTPNTSQAIRQYQRLANLPLDGRPSNKLLSHLNSAAGAAQKLLLKLNDARTQQIAEARADLEDVFGPDWSGTAAPSEIVPAGCFATPTTHCLLRLAENSAQAVTREDLKDWALSTVIEAFARTGDLNAAMAAARTIDDPRSVLAAISAVTVILASEGRGDEALTLAERMPSPVIRDKARRAVATAEATAGDIEQALATATGIVEPREQFEALVAISWALLEQGKNDKATDLATRAEKIATTFGAAIIRDWALNELANLQAELGNYARARAMTDDISSSSGRVQVLCALATLEAENHELDAARQALSEASLIARTITRRAEQHQARGRLAAAHAALGEFDIALRHAGNIELGYTHAFAISRIAIAMGEQGQVVEAIKLAKSVEDERLRVDALLIISRTRTELDDSAGATLAGDEVKKAVEGIRSSLDRTSVLADLAIAEALAGRDGKTLFAQALAELRDMNDNWARARMLAKAATTLFVLRGL